MGTPFSTRECSQGRWRSGTVQSFEQCDSMASPQAICNSETSVVGSGVCLAISDAGERCENETPPVISFFIFLGGPIPLIYILVVFSAYIHCVD